MITQELVLVVILAILEPSQSLARQRGVVSDSSRVLWSQSLNMSAYGGSFVPEASLGKLRSSRSTKEGDPMKTNLSFWCPVHSCEAQPAFAAQHGLSCKCDVLCSYYDDCCSDSRYLSRGPHHSPVTQHLEDALQLPQRPASWLCQESVGTSLPHEGVYVVNFCPANSLLEDVMRCVLKVSSDERYSPVMDIPVTSSSSRHNLVYRNAFCARCHNQPKYLSRYGTVLCSHPLRSREVLAKMDYLNGQKKWTGFLNSSDLLDLSDFEYTNVTCVLVPESDEKIGRPCARDIVRYYNHSTKCPSYLGIVADAEGNLYKNYECALYNGVHEKDIVCPIFPALTDLPSPYMGWHELLNLEMQPGDCSNSEHLSNDKSFCTAVQCNPSLVNHTCDVEVIRIKLPKYAPSHISFYCLTMTYSIGNVTMLHNNHLYVNVTEEEYRYGEYEVAEDGYVRVCRFSDRWSTSMVVSFRFLITLSSIALILHFFIFFSLPKRRNTPSKNLCSLSIALFMSYILLSIVLYLTQNRALCVGISVLLYYFLCSVCFWMNVLSIDICRTFRAKLFSVKSNRLFIHYSIYAWTIPLAFACIALSVDLLAPRDFPLRPEFGTLRCWFNNKWGFFVFYVLPSTIVMAVNLFLYIISVISIYQQHRAGSAAAMSVQKPQNSEANAKKSRPGHQKPMTSKETTENSKSDSLQHKPSALKLLKCDSEVALGKFKDKMQKRIAAHRELKIRLLLYCKLALIMGMTWLISFIAIVLKSSMAEHIFIVMNGLQGTFIFIAFDCKQKVWQDLVNKFWYNTNETRNSVGNSAGATSSVSVQNTPKLIKLIKSAVPTKPLESIPDVETVDTVL